MGGNETNDFSLYGESCLFTHLLRDKTSIAVNWSLIFISNLFISTSLSIFLNRETDMNHSFYFFFGLMKGILFSASLR